MISFKVCILIISDVEIVQGEGLEVLTWEAFANIQWNNQ